MDIGVQGIVDTIVGATTDYLVVFMPLFTLIGGLLLAVGIMFYLVLIIKGKNPINDDQQEEVAE